MDRENLADDRYALLDALDDSVSSMDTCFANLTPSTEQNDSDCDELDDSEDSDILGANGSDFDEYSEYEVDDSDADKDYVPSSDSESSNEAVTYTTSTAIAKKRPMPRLTSEYVGPSRKRFHNGNELSSDITSNTPEPTAEEEPIMGEVDDLQSPNSPQLTHWAEVGPDDDFPLAPVTYSEIPGPKHMPNPQAGPVAYFYLFFTNLLLRSLARETNRYANQFISNGSFRDNSRVKEWLPVTVDEMKAFIITILNMGIVRLPTIYSYWSKCNSTGHPWFRKMFTRNRFQLILKFFHLVNNELLAQQPYDPCAKFQPIIDHANVLFRHHFTSHQQISIDESLIGTKSRTVLQQYLPKKKHHRWGIKLWMLCDSVKHYCLGFYVYRGARDRQESQEMKELGTGCFVVKKLLTLCNYFNKGYHLFTDNFFSSIPLAEYLYNLGTYFTATIRANRKGLPAQLTKEKFGVGVTKFFKKDFLLMCGNRDKKSQKKQVLLISTSSQATTSEVSRRVRNTIEPEVISKPDIILQYNKYMGGVDTSDMMLYTYLDERKTLKYWKKVVFSVMNRMLLNAYILYAEHKKANNQKPVNRLKFIQTIVDQLGEEWLEKRNNSVPQSDPAPKERPKSAFGLQRLPSKKLRRCHECSTEAKKSRSAYVCVRCEKGVHPQCLNKHQC